jgi:hypothetical protein
VKRSLQRYLAGLSGPDGAGAGWPSQQLPFDPR